MYCTYLTTYSGDKLPKWYLGSTSMEKIKNGYHGSVKSMKYKDIWKSELKEHPELFKSEIIKEFETREEALQSEYELQIGCDVVKSENYINMSLAAPNGFFGREMFGNTNPNFGKIGGLKGQFGENHPKYGKKESKETRKKKSEAHMGLMVGKNHPFFGKPAYNKDIPHSQETKNKISQANKGKLSGSKNPLFGKIRITNGVHNTQVDEEMLDFYISLGYRKGITMKEKKFNPENSIKGRIQINNEIVTKIIKKEEFENYINNGFIKGRLK
jgi:hypothetical protein